MQDCFLHHQTPPAIDPAALDESVDEAVARLAASQPAFADPFLQDSQALHAHPLLEHWQWDPPGEGVKSDASAGKEEGGGGSGRHPWTEEEEARFRIALEMFGPKERSLVTQGRIPVGLGAGAARSMASFIGTRSVQQVRSHAQKHFIKLVSSPGEAEASGPDVQGHADASTSRAAAGGRGGGGRRRRDDTQEASQQQEMKGGK
ncbi:hypothetical protein GUITHDRAFT_122581 [Guillardia theta CCMP2712]|uniref:Myb-like domain-containing protein n=1 Tax=Guillardia theta (strain CCMP2712) TaxID=905079 RepID=L1I543_GUITC|nr:hypothetical protein GUITHDRAFT_122581 [Guillardia theta CCMP2712]EKX31212.1 hypothetical protein GUITHDRAFT_122581 [Guillardia theta CCMP2712]|eukprot:XP_005818192.1 hypothetical protein GUITHDRAFT_122581 [Guillardia theta CCMP2712]